MLIQIAPTVLINPAQIVAITKCEEFNWSVTMTNGDNYYISEKHLQTLLFQGLTCDGKIKHDW